MQWARTVEAKGESGEHKEADKEGDEKEGADEQKEPRSGLTLLRDDMHEWLREREDPGAELVKQTCQS